jgi:hypothetical protein
MVPYIIRECIAFMLRVSKVRSFLDLMTVENEYVPLEHSTPLAQQCNITSQKTRVLNLHGSENLGIAYTGVPPYPLIQYPWFQLSTVYCGPKKI